MYISNQPKTLYPKYKPVNFNGLTKDMKKMAYPDVVSIKKCVKKHPQSMGIVGSLPYEWISKIPYESREKAIKNFYKDFKLGINDLRNSNIEKAEKKFDDAFKKAGILNKNQNLCIDYVNEGSFGEVYKLSGINNEKEYIVKVFDLQANGEFLHGNYIEQNRAAYWQEQVGSNGDRVKFYFGDMKTGYMINQYISPKTPICYKTMPSEIYGLEKTDEMGEINGHNRINGYSIDYGGLSIASPELVKNKTARVVSKKIYALSQNQRTKAFEKFIKTDNDDIKIGLVNSIGLLDEQNKTKYFKVLATSNNQKVKEELTYKLRLLDYKERTENFKTLAKGANNQLKKHLLMNFSYLPRKDRKECFKLLAKDANLQVRMMMSTNIGYLEPKDGLECLKYLLSF